MINFVYKKSNVSIGKNEFFGRFVIMTFIQILNYVRYSLTIPIIFFYTAIIVMILILIQELIFGGTLKPLLSFSNIPPSFELDKKDILMIYGWLSLVFYIIGSLIEKLFKIKMFSSIKRKLKITLFINLLLSLPIVFISFLLLSNESITSSLFISLVVFLFGMIFSVLAFVSGHIINKIINFLQESLQSN